MARRREPARHHGLLLIDKPTGVTSHDVVQKLRRRLGQREIGHTGTLDPMASGLLVIALGRATRLARFVEATDKRYRGTVRLGAATNTFDADGEIVETAPIPAGIEAQIVPALNGLTGRIAQTVPAFSAVKVGGERLYARARRGEAVEAPTRTITIHTLEATRIALPDIDLDLRCSKGTYVRSLAVQIGAALGLPAHLVALRRTEVGSHGLDRAIAAEAVDPDALPLVSPLDAVAQLPSLALDEVAARDVSFGRILSADTVRRLAGGAAPGPGPTRLVGPDGALWAVAELPEGLAEAAPDAAGLGYACVLVTASVPN
jgi:tRNA pseudouridine55 synthase